MLKNYKISVMVVKQLLAGVIALVGYLLSKHFDPALAEAVNAVLGPLLALVAAVVFGVDAAGLAMQNTEKADGRLEDW